MHSLADAEPEREAAQGMSGCREAVEILTRIPRRITYDVHKDGVKVGVLTFMKSAWRLGETVQGVVELNDRSGRARVLKVCTYPVLCYMLLMYASSAFCVPGST